MSKRFCSNCIEIDVRSRMVNTMIFPGNLYELEELSDLTETHLDCRYLHAYGGGHPECELGIVTA
ncbi:protein of unknown function [Candidatus Methylomirabilis oxygeniifera]|uniref:Uncharacterized protein n=1 Tax=Methylomirabilis oxygeniifera TaxID=671143 RepID=D5MJH8_METO1|nr:protein of unknown function [Candidatus Methylomirabilis oxyfera]